MKRRARLAVVAMLGVGIALTLTLAFGAAAASAVKAPIYDFGSSGTLGGQFNGARGIAVNQTGNGGVPAGTVYVVDFNNNRIQSFDADGNFIRAWGQDVDSGGGTGFEICEVAANCKAGVSGGGAGQFNAIAGGIAVDQATGNVAVFDRNNRRVQQFDATGHFLRTWGKDVDSGGGTDFEICEVAANCKQGDTGAKAGEFGSNTVVIAGIGTDSSGNVYVADAENRRVQKFSPSGAFLAMGGWDVDSANPSTEYEVCAAAANCKAGTGGTGAGQFGATNLPSFLATSPAGEVYVVGRSDGTIYHLTPALAFDPGFAPAGVPSTASNRNAVAVNPTDGHLLFTKPSATVIYELDPATQLVVAEHPADAAYTPVADGNEWVGLAINSASGRMYGDRTTSASFVRILDEGIFPQVTIGVATGVTGTKATLNGTVDPNGLELTECKFEYGTTTSYGQSVPCAESPAEIGSGTDPVAVHADITGLTPNGAKYNLRLVAANPGTGNGPHTVKSTNESLTTIETVTTEPPSEVTGTAATLNGTVIPDGVGLSECAFEYGPTTAYGQVAECTPTAAAVGSGTGPVAVHADVVLQPGSVYHYRLVGVYLSGSVGAGADESFQTLGPVLGDIWSQDVTLGEATLKAEIDPEGNATTYRFEYGTQGPCSANPCASIPLPDGDVGSDSAVHEVSALLEGLHPGAVYHWRVVATNSDAVNEGPDRAFTTYAPLGSQTCPNAAFRLGPGAGLPDCRAYEMVSPPDKGGGDIVAPTVAESNREGAFRQASTDGERVTFTSTSAFGDAVRSTRSNQYMASRGAAGWSTHGLYPAQGTTVFDPAFDSALQYDFSTNFQAFTPDLCFALMKDHNLVPLTGDAIADFTNLYLRDNCGPGADTYQALTIGGAPLFSGGVDLDLQARAYSADHGHLVFAAHAALESLPPAAAGTQPQIYDFSGGELRLVSVLPGGEANPAASFVGSAPSGGFLDPARDSNLSRAVSADGSRIFWTSRGTGGAPSTIYLRAGGAETIPVSGTGTNNEFWTASSDGSAAVFSEGSDLFEFDVESETSDEIAGEVGGVVGASEDLSYLYFTSEEALAAGAVAGESNLYLRREGAVRLIATLAAKDRDEPGIDKAPPINHAARVSPDGHHLAFMSLAPLTGFDNADAAGGEPLREVYLYDAAASGGAGELLCASCNPSGARPAGGLMRRSYARPGTYFNDGFDRRAAAWIPTSEWTSNTSRPLADDGSRLFFMAFDALVPEDTNEAQDVYQWEAPGTGGCTLADPRYFEANGGCISLISTGKSPEESVFLDASADGRDVFFTTASDIEQADLGAIDLYDARTGGGFPPPPPPPPECLGDACQSVPAPPEAQTPASAAFHGPGDPEPRAAKRRQRCPEGKRKVRRKGKVRCVAKQKRQRRRAAANDRRAGR